jgi:2,5-diamino-6-(ribosylamino)-4(3H)-pyrimidinone 5'-phosphate reductase
VAHAAVALDGATTGFEPDVAKFYELARTWEEDVTLAGADTILAQETALAEAPRPGPAAGAPLLAVVDGRGRVREWEALRDVGHWSDVLALRAEATPPRPSDRPTSELVVGAERVDLRAALEALGERHRAKVVRVDSGGALTGALLAAGLVDEVSLLIHPRVGDVQAGRPWHGGAPVATAAFELLANETLDGDLVWLRYRRGR